jgi:cytochrome c-type biogenesis protein CcmH
MLWVLLILMSVAAGAALLGPLFVRRRPSPPRAAYDLEIYRDQLDEVSRDRARGVIDEAQAAAARTEVGRRALTAADAVQKAEIEAPLRHNRSWPIAIGIAMPIAALALYLDLGSPGLPGQPLAERRASAPVGERSVADMVDGLAARLQRAPNDIQGWALLARSYATLERNAEAAQAWRKAMELSANDPEFAGPYGESLVLAADGMVSPEARKAFERVLSAAPADPRARFYIGLAQAQEGAAREALQTWTDLAASAPADAPWLSMIRQRIAALAQEARIDAATLRPSSPPSTQAAAPPPAAPSRGPNAADLEAAQGMSSEDRTVMIRGMVEGLAARLEREPNDIEGWRRLGRARRVLGDIEQSKAAYARAAELAPDRVDLLQDYAGALLQGVREGDKLPPDLVAVMRRILALDPEHSDALWFVGLAEAEAGNRPTAIGLWSRLIAKLPPSAAGYAEIKARLDRLRAAN